MKKINNIFNIFIIILLSITLCGCKKDDNDQNNNDDKPNIEIVEVVETLNIITVNDFHGALEQDSDGRYGAARLAYLIEQDMNKAEAAVLVSAGDMFQGTAIASYNHGKSVVDVMNLMDFDAMCLGNHEFDWGFDKIYQYVDGNPSNGEADFPFLGCNIIEKSTNQLVEGIKPYEIIERGGLKIGIIGFMGDTVESSISPSFIEPYEFTTVLPAVKKYVKEMREENECDVVIAIGHQDDRYNESLASLKGSERVDCIINSHSHETYTGTLTRDDGVVIPYVQAGSAGEKYGYVTLGINTETKEVTGGFAEIKPSRGNKYDLEVEQYIKNLVAETAPIFSRVIGVAKEYVNRDSCVTWAATALRDAMNVDLAVINYGGIRSQGLPIYQGSNITVSTVHGFMPFDNIVKTVTLYGSDVRKIVTKFVYSANVTYNESTGDIYINGKKLVNSQKYTVASIDYIFDNSWNPFLGGENINNTGILFRDILIERIEQDKSIIIPK